MWVNSTKLNLNHLRFDQWHRAQRSTPAAAASQSLGHRKGPKAQLAPKGAVWRLHVCFTLRLFSSLGFDAEHFAFRATPWAFGDDAFHIFGHGVDRHSKSSVPTACYAWMWRWRCISFSTYQILERVVHGPWSMVVLRQLIKVCEVSTGLQFRLLEKSSCTAALVWHLESKNFSRFLSLQPTPANIPLPERMAVFTPMTCHHRRSSLRPDAECSASRCESEANCSTLQRLL